MIVTSTISGSAHIVTTFSANCCNVLFFLGSQRSLLLRKKYVDLRGTGGSGVQYCSYSVVVVLNP